VIVTIIAWIVFGAIAGWIASLIMKRRETVVGNIILGILGAVVGGFLAGLVGAPGVTAGFSLYSLVVSVIGAAVLIWAGRLFYH
jgi:uncharacterized membrane protein YeaQ/YmgE (transglycosylase-associated protein family)